MRIVNKENPINVVVRRSQWLRGESRHSRLYRRKDKKMCCMGFAELEAGARIMQIRDKHAVKISVNAIQGSNKSTSQVVFPDDKGFIHALYHYNDSPVLTDTQREQHLIETGKQAGINFIFVD